MKVAAACLGASMAFCPPALAIELYSIGNSLTFDALRSYQGTVEYTINCNQNLQRIFERPTETCLPQKAESRPWDEAFGTESYDFVSVQPFRGTTLTQDANAISSWMMLQPDASFIVHTGWTSAGGREGDYNAPLGDEMMKHSEAYFSALRAELAESHPGRVVGSTNIIGVLDDIALDIANDASEIESIAALYRDPIHFNSTGQYIATNALNRAMGKESTSTGFDGVSLTVRDYFDAKIAANVDVVPEPASLLVLAAGGGLVLLRRDGRSA